MSFIEINNSPSKKYVSRLRTIINNNQEEIQINYQNVTLDKFYKLKKRTYCEVLKNIPQKKVTYFTPKRVKNYQNKKKFYFRPINSENIKIISTPCEN